MGRHDVANKVTTQPTKGKQQPALHQLSDDHRWIINSHGVEGNAPSEATEITGISPGTVKPRQKRARERLQELFEKGPERAFFTSIRVRREKNDELRAAPRKLGPNS